MIRSPFCEGWVETGSRPRYLAATFHGPAHVILGFRRRTLHRAPDVTAPRPGGDASPFGGRAAQRAEGLGLGWSRLAVAVAERMPVDEIEHIWVFPPVRREDREWGTAVIARGADQGRLRVYTGSYLLVIRGRDRGQGQVAVAEVGESPETVLADVVHGVPERAGEDEPPIEIAPALWFRTDDESTTAG